MTQAAVEAGRSRTPLPELAGLFLKLGTVAFGSATLIVAAPAWAYVRLLRT